MNETAKPKPGPWRIEKEYSNGCEVGPYIMTDRDPQGRRRIIARIGGAPYLETDKGAETYATAALVAGAPDLLDACERIVAAYDAYLDDEGSVSFDDHVSSHDLEAARAAVAKAKGVTTSPIR